MINSSPSLRNFSIHNIVIENEELRKALIQSQQNEHLIQQLAATIDRYKIKENELFDINAALGDKINAQKAMMEEKDNAFSEEMQYVFCQHDKILHSKEQELKKCMLQLQNLAEKNRTIQEYVRVYHQRERQLSENYEIEITKYRKKISEFQNELDSVYRSLQLQKSAFEKAKSVLIAQQQVQKGEIVNLTTIIKRLESDNLMLMDYSKEQQANLIKIEQQQKATLITLRQKLISQEEEIHNLLHMSKGLQSSNQIIAKELEDLKILQAHLSTDNQTLLAQNSKIINLLSESDKESKYLRHQIMELEATLSKNVQIHQIQLQDLRNQKLELLRSKTQAETYSNAKVAELRELSASSSRLQALACKQEAHIKGLVTDLNALQQLLSIQKQRNAELSIKIKEAVDINVAIRQQSERYQQINKKLQIQVEQLQAQTLNLFTKNELNSKDINKQFLDRMNTMLIKFREERQEQTKYHAIEKEKIKERHQFEMKQMQLDFLKKISLLEQQLALSQKFQILTQRNSNIFTYTSTKL